MPPMSPRRRPPDALRATTPVPMKTFQLTGCIGGVRPRETATLWLSTSVVPESGGLQLPARIGRADKNFTMRNTRLVMVRQRWPSLSDEIRRMAAVQGISIAMAKKRDPNLQENHNKWKHLRFEIEDAETSPVPGWCPLSVCGACFLFESLEPVDPELLRGTGWPGAPKHRRRVHAAGTVVMGVSVDAQKADHYRAVTEDKPGGFSGEVRRLLDDEYPMEEKFKKQV